MGTLARSYLEDEKTATTPGLSARSCLAAPRLTALTHPAPVNRPPDDLRIYQHLPSRPTYEEMERAFARMRDRLSAGMILLPSADRGWRGGRAGAGGPTEPSPN